MDGLPSYEYASILAKRVLFSRAYTFFYTSLIVAGIVEAIFIFIPHGGVGKLPRHPVFTLLEGYVTIGLVCEITLRALQQRHDFCRHRANILDAVVVVISLLASLLYALDLETRGEMLLADALVTTRVIFRLLRLISISKNYKSRVTRARELEVNLFDGADEGPEGAMEYGLHLENYAGEFYSPVSPPVSSGLQPYAGTPSTGRSGRQASRVNSSSMINNG